MSKAVIELIGVVEESFPNATFRVRILSDEAKGHELLCHLAGRMRKHRVRILPGDRVKLEMTPYDLGKGRIVFRFRSDQVVSLSKEPVPSPEEESMTVLSEDTPSSAS